MTGSIFRRAFLAVIAMFAVGSVGHAASEAKAVEIRFFVPQSTGLFEVKGSTGGRFITSPTSEFITVPGRGPIRVVGYTDRVQRGETLVIQVNGRGPATITVTRDLGGRTSNLVGPVQVTLPIVFTTVVNPDNITVCVNQYGAVKCRRVPIGTRP